MPIPQIERLYVNLEVDTLRNSGGFFQGKVLVVEAGLTDIGYGSPTARKEVESTLAFKSSLVEIGLVGIKFSGLCVHLSTG